MTRALFNFIENIREGKEERLTHISLHPPSLTTFDESETVRGK